MANGQINQLLEFANMQMAAEAFLSRVNDTTPNVPSAAEIRDRLIEGNTHASKFMLVQAEQFTSQYEVLAQYRNDPLLPGGTGFSATLFRKREGGELTLSFRSTEYLDDAVRDNKSTNDLEIKDIGWALGQIAEMEAWYRDLRQTHLAAGDGNVRNFNVTGYSLGAHLATAFNILRREESTETGVPNPILATYTFNGAGTGQKLNGRRLTDLLADFNQIRADYRSSPQWNALSESDRMTIEDGAQFAVNKINAEWAYVAGLSGLQNPAFGGATAPLGMQTSLDYQVAALVVGRDTVGALDSNYPTVGGPIFISSNLLLAPTDQRFSNMVDVVGMETQGLATSFVANSGIHYGNRVQVHIEAQPLYRGNFPLSAIGNSVTHLGIKLLVNNPTDNDFADTHSLVLLVDSLSLMAAMEKLAPTLTIEMAGQLLAAMSNAKADQLLFTQGKAEGDSLERMLDALRRLALGPSLDPTFNRDQMLQLLEGNTWHQSAYRVPFHEKLVDLRERISALTALSETFVFDSLLTRTPAQLSESTANPDALAYRYALRELNPFALLGDTANAAIYSWHNLAGQLDLYSAGNRTGTLTTQWIADRVDFLSHRNKANTTNVSLLPSTQVTEPWRFVDLPLNYKLTIIPPGGTAIEVLTHRAIFDGDSSDALHGGKVSDRLYGAGGADYLEGKADNDYLEGGTGLDVYAYSGAMQLLGGANDGADVIRDIDGKGILRYMYSPLLGSLQTTVIADASSRQSDTEWRSANGKFTYTVRPNEEGRIDLEVTINGDAGGALTLKDFRDGDFGIRLWGDRQAPQAVVRTFYGDKENWDADSSQDGIQPAPDGFGNFLRADGQDGRNDVALPDRSDFFYGAPTAEVERFMLGNNNDGAYSDGTDSATTATGSVDWLQGGPGRDDLVSGAGNDLIEAGADGVYENEVGGDIAYGALGDDEIYGTEKIALAAAINAGDTNIPTSLKGDLLSGGPGEDWLIAGAANDFLLGGSDRDLMIAGAGDDDVFGDGDFIALTPLWTALRTITTDPVTGTNTYSIEINLGELSPIGAGAGGNDVVYAGSGSDWIFAYEGDDFVDGGPGNDVAFGMDGDDVLIGGAGDDLLVGDSGPASAVFGGDYLDGGAGNDRLQGDGGNDVLIGGAGDDTLTGGAGKDIYVFNKGDGKETIFDTPDDPAKADASVLVLGDGFFRSNVRFFPGSLGIDLGPSNPEDLNSPHDVIHFEGFDQINPDATPLLTEIRFGDGTSMSYAEILAQGFDIDGTAGNDNSNPDEPPNLVGTGVTDRIWGFAGNDLLFGLAGDDMLDGGDDADSLVGGAGADTIHGGSGNDVIWADGESGGMVAPDGADVIYAGEGTDLVYGFDGGDQILGEGGNDTLYGEHGADLVDGGTSNDFVYGDALYMVLGTPILNYFDDNANDTLRGGDGNDVLNAGGGDDILEGGADSDRLEAEAGNDALDGGDGADTLWGGAGADTLTGGMGDGDVLSGEAGDDVYIFNLGDGEDRIHEQPDTVLDFLAFGSGITVADISFSRGTGNALVAWHANGTDQVSIPDWYLGAGYRLDRFDFADATQIMAAQAETSALTSFRGGSGDDTLSGNSSADTMYGLAGNDWLSGNAGNDTLIGGTGGDTLIGGDGADTYRVALGDGADLIQETGLVDDTLIFGASVAGTDITYDRVGSNLVMRHANGTDSVTVYNWFEPGFSYVLQSVTFESDGTTLSLSQLSTLATVIPHQYTLDLGDGAKLIEDWGGIDTLTFGAAIAKADIQTSRVGVDLVLTHVNGSDRVTVKGWFDDVAKQIEQVTFSATGETFTHSELTDPFLTLNGTAGNDSIEGGNAYGETIDGLAGNDVIYGFAGEDQITGGLGNDTLNGGAGADRYYFVTGDGADRVNEDNSGGNVIQFGPGLVDKLVSTFPSDGSNLITFTGLTDSVRIFNNFSSTILKFELYGTATANTLTGSDWGDVVQALGGNDSVYGGAGSDEIYGGAGNDTLEGGRDVDYLYGEAGDDVIDGGSRTLIDTDDGFVTYFHGGPGNDTLYGDGGATGDQYFFNLGDGQDLIVDEPYFGNAQWHYSQFDELNFGPGITEGSLSAVPSGSDLIVNVTPTDRVALRNWMSNPMYRVDYFTFSDGTQLDTAGILQLAYTQRGTEGDDTLTGAESQADRLYGNGGDDVLSGLGGNDLLDGGTGNDTLSGGTGDDQLNGGAGADALNGGDGNDTYEFGPGAGQDAIIDSGGVDTVQFSSGVTASNVVLSRNANSLVLTISATADALTITDYFVNPAFRIEDFNFADGSLLPGESSILDQFLNIRGTAGDDVLSGTAGVDILYGLDGNDALTALADNDTLLGGVDNDTLTGGTGNDNLQGEAGDDHYQYELGDGQDVVSDTAGFDTLVFGAGIATTSVSTTRSGSNLMLGVNVTGNTGQVTVQNYFNGQETEEIRFADATVWDAAAVRARVLAASSTSGSDLIIGYESNDTISSLAGHDTVYAGAGDDMVDGGSGSDTLYGEEGNDHLTAGSGDAKNATVNNYLYGGSGDDVLLASAKTDFLYGDAGNDILRGSNGISIMNDSSGNNLLDAQGGSDQLYGGDQNDLMIGGAGLDSFDGDSDLDGLRGRDILAFNKSDGQDLVSRLASGSTISIGGGTLYSNLALEAQNTALRLKTGSNHYISLGDWYLTPANKAVSTLQIVIEGTRDYKTSSSNPMNNLKIQRFDFLGLVAAFDAAGRPSNFNVAANLPGAYIAGSDTEAIGGAIAYQYARSGSLGALTYDQMRAVISAPEFAVSVQPIAFGSAAAAESSAMDSSDPAAGSEVQADAERLTIEGGSATDEQRAFHDGPISRSTRDSPMPEFNSPATGTIAPAAIAGVRGAGFNDAAPQRPAGSSAAAPDASLLADAPGGRAITGTDDRDSVVAHRSDTGGQVKREYGSGSALEALVEQWFNRRSLHEDLSLLDDVWRGEAPVSAPASGSVAAAWEASHRWLAAQAKARNQAGNADADGADLSGLSLLGTGSAYYDMPRAVVGLQDVAGHQLKAFRGLREGMNVLPQA